MAALQLVHRRLSDKAVAHSRVPLPALNPPLVQRRGEVVGRRMELVEDRDPDRRDRGGPGIRRQGTQRVISRS